MTFRLSRSPILPLLFVVGALPICAATLMVGDPNNPSHLTTDFDQGLAQGAKDITITPGLYDIPDGSANTFRLNSLSDVTIHAKDVVLIFEGVSCPLYFLRSKNVTWDGGTFRFARPAFTQGRVTAVATDERGEMYCDWQIDAGYATTLDPIKSTFNVVDPKTRLLKLGAGDWGTREAEQLGPGLFRLRYSKPAPVAVHDWLVTRVKAGNSMVHLDLCQECTLKNITCENGGFATFFETGGQGGNHYFHCRIQTGPRPTGASEDELVSCGADGFHSTGTTVGPDIEDCTFTGVFLDDCIAIHGSFSRVIESSGTSLVVRGHPENKPVVGEPQRISNMQGFFAEATCVAVEELPDGDYRATLNKALDVPIDHAMDEDPHKGTKVNSPDHCGRGFRILRCRLGDTRSRGILVKADDGVIDRCRIEGCAMSGVSIGPEFWWNEANYAWNVKVSNNTFLNCSKGRDQGTLWIHGDGAVGNRNIVIQKNIFETCYGPYLMKIECADGVQISDNQIKHSFQVDSGIPESLVWLSQSRNIKLLNNVVSDLGSVPGELVVLAPDMNPNDVQHNDSVGISRRDSPSSSP